MKNRQLAGLGDDAPVFVDTSAPITITQDAVMIGGAVLIAAGVLAARSAPQKKRRRSRLSSYAQSARQALLAPQNPVWQTLILTVATGVATALLVKRLSGGTGE